MESKDLYPETTKELADKKAALAPKNIEAWRNFSKTVFEAGALPEKTKQLIAVAVAHVRPMPMQQLQWPRWRIIPKLKTMKQRLNYAKIAPDALKAMVELEKYVADSGLQRSLYELVKTRASQINGCAYCLDMHTKDARKAGETEQRLYALNAWRETPFYTERERAALEWTEALTLISENDVSDLLYESVHTHFNEKEMVALTMAIVAINGWNRLAISFRTVPGTYEPQ